VPVVPVVPVIDLEISEFLRDIFQSMRRKLRLKHGKEIMKL
jgi:hypothetical protein